MLRRLVVLPFILLTGIGFSGMHRTFPWPYPPFDRLITQRSGLQDVSLITAGFRCLAADLAWVELLQYVGGGFLPGEDTTRAYAELKPMTLRVTRMDPYFRHAYIYSASMLAFFHNINRPQEALDVLFEGMRNNPEYWPFRTTAAAIGFMKTDQFDRMARELEASIQHPECPTLIKSILANGYKAHGRPADAVRVWTIVLNNPRDELYHAKAAQEIKLLEKIPHE
jgi:hypothetical protein